jgi:aerobic-type carbon monoxide dehydrogenase small subunit (CoxS/CutS family)
MLPRRSSSAASAITPRRISCTSTSAARASGDPALIAASPKPTEDEIIAGMTNICRCGTYNRIKAAIQLAAGDVKRG